MRLRGASGVGVGIILAAAGCAAGPSPTATEPMTTQPAETATASPRGTAIDTGAWVEFTSPRHGYSIEHPPDWTTTHGTARWGFNAISLPGSPVLDELDSGDQIFVAASQPIPSDMDDEAWIEGYAALLVAADPKCGRPLDEWEPITIDGREGATVATCELFAVVTIAGRGYEFRMLGDLDLPLYEAMLDGITLEPDRADDS